MKAKDIPIGDVFDAPPEQLIRLGHPNDKQFIVARVVRRWEDGKPILNESSTGHRLIDPDADVTNHRPVLRAELADNSETDPLNG